MITTPALRAKLRDFTAKVTVPIAFTADGVFRDSTDIARWANTVGEGSSLFDDDEEVTRSWVATAEDIASSGRVISTFEVARDPEAMRDNVPGFIPRHLRGASLPLVRLGAQYLRYKYDFDDADVADAERTMRAALERVANRLELSEHLGTLFGWSDIAVASSLQFVSPHESWVRFPRASRRCWTRHELAGDFEDVLQWRDDLLARHPVALERPHK